MSFKASKYQERIFEHIKYSKSNAVIEAVAGSGKTTTLIEAMKISNIKNVIFVAFNKHIAEEMKGKVPSNVRVSTMHSFGLEQIKNTYKKTFLEKSKSSLVLKENMSLFELDSVFGSDRIEHIKNMIALADLFRLNLSYSMEECQLTASKHNIVADDTLILNTLQLIKSLNNRRDIIDYIDMIYIPAIEDINIRQYDLVLVDECQDLSASQIALLKKMVTPNGRIISVGDRNQAIYGFSGADSESFQKLCDIDNTVLLPLSISYRCSKKVVEHAKSIVPNIEASETAIEGLVSHYGSLENVKDGDFVLCRTNAPLISLALNFLVSGKKATIKGVDISEKIMRTIKSTKKEKLTDVIKVLRANYQRMLNNKNEDNRMNLVYTEDMISCIEILSRGCYSINDVKKKLDNLFSDDKKDGIILSTAHKSKGLEANRVHIIKPELMPLKFAVKDWEITQENNLHYVAITRAKESLFYIPSPKDNYNDY